MKDNGLIFANSLNNIMVRTIVMGPNNIFFSMYDIIYVYYVLICRCCQIVILHTLKKGPLWEQQKF